MEERTESFIHYDSFTDVQRLQAGLPLLHDIESIRVKDNKLIVEGLPENDGEMHLLLAMGWIFNQAYGWHLPLEG